MTNFKTLFFSALLCTVAALSFAKAPVTSHTSNASAPANVMTGVKANAKAKVKRQKSALPAKSKNQVRRAVRGKKMKVNDSRTSNSKGPGLEAY